MCTVFLAITNLVHHRTVRIVLSAALLAAFAAALALLAALTRHWGWSPSSVDAGACVLTALTVTPVRGWLTGRAEGGFLRDAYDTAGTVLRLCIDLCQAAPHEIGPLVVTRLSSVLDLRFALLLTAHDPQPWFHAHPHSAIPRALREAVAERARELFAVPALAGALVEKVQRLPILFLPVWDGHEAPAVLCLGPKRSGDSYTPQDQALLGTLARHLAVVLANKRLRAQLDEQMAALHCLAEERKLLAERAFSAAEEERRRLAGVLHDEAVQLGGEVVRRLEDLLARPDLPLDSHMELAAVASLGHDLVVRLREVVADLYPPPLQTVGLLPALQALLRDIEHHTPLTCPLSADPSLDGERLPPAHELALYNVAREAVCNAVLHAQATTVHVTLCREGEHLCLTVCDDGVGFTVQPVGALLAAGHLGLALMEQRVRDLGGTLQIVTSPGCGTTIDVRVPILMSSATAAAQAASSAALSTMRRVRW